MKRVLLVQPSLQPPGGGNGVASWTLQALVDRHDVTVLSWWPVDIEPINRFFGTTLRRDQFRAVTVPAWWRALDRVPVPASLLRSALLMRHTRSVTDGFDVVIGVHNEFDYGRRGIQYVHYPTYLRPRPDVDLRWYHNRLLLDLYYRAADAVAGLSFERIRRNVTLANSNWTAARIHRLLGIDAVTVYPPVADPAPPVAWAGRAPGFLAVGRVSPEKDYERVMRILARVRARHPGLTLTIICTVDRHGRRYYSELTSMARSLGPWVRFAHDLPTGEVRALMASNRYGLHGMREEHFGMAPAEMARAGMVVWVPNGGGQTEIVGDEPMLRFDTDDEAVEKIARVLGDEGEQHRLREWLSSRQTRFSTARFVDEIRGIVDRFDG